MEKFNKIKFNEVNIKRVNDFETSFVAYPLERGFSHTLGNSLRRVLLSYVGSLAPFALRIKGVSNEFTTIENVKEDVVNIILNVKNIKFKLKGTPSDEQIYRLHLLAKEGDVEARQFELPIDVEVVNPDAKVATVEKEGALEMELYLKLGRGFISFEKNKEIVKSLISKIETKIDTGEIIAVDSLFSPIENVSYEVEELNSISEKIEEKLTINVRTNGSVAAKEAISEASHILMSHLGVFQSITNVKFEEEIFIEGKKTEEESKLMTMPIIDLELSVRSYNALKKNGISKISELVAMRYEELETIKHLGKKSLTEIVKKLAELGIQIKSKGA